MKTVQLTPNVRFLSMDDEEGTIGVFIIHNNDKVFYTQEVHTREEFSDVYEEITTKLEQF